MMSVEPSYSIVCNYETVATFREMIAFVKGL